MDAGKTGPHWVDFIYVAAAPDHFPPNWRESREAYSPHGGRGWKPYLPLGNTVRHLAVSVAQAPGMDFYAEELEVAFSISTIGALAGKIREAESQNRIVVMLVDYWTMAVAGYREALLDFDEKNFFNCAILLPLNERDPETRDHKSELQQLLRGVLRRWSRLSLMSSFCFRDLVQSEEDFRLQLQESLFRLKGEILQSGQTGSLPKTSKIDPGTLLSSPSSGDEGAAEPGFEDPKSSLNSDFGQVFISYSREDRKWFRMLQDHLKPLERTNRIVSWNEQQIRPGTLWREEIRRAIELSSVAVLLVSAPFIASDYITKDELPRLLDAAAKNGLVILCVAVGTCRYDLTPIGGYRFLNETKAPLSRKTDQDTRNRELVEICRRIEEALGRAAGPAPG